MKRIERKLTKSTSQKRRITLRYRKRLQRNRQKVIEEKAKKTILGLPSSYYFANFNWVIVLCILIPIPFLYEKRTWKLLIFIIIFTIVNAVLYPFAKYIVIKAIKFLVGDAAFHYPFMYVDYRAEGLLMFFSIVLAPICILYLYCKTPPKENLTHQQVQSGHQKSDN